MSKHKKADEFAELTRRMTEHIENLACGQWVMPLLRKQFPDMSDAADAELVDTAERSGLKIARQRQRDGVIFILMGTDGKVIATGKLTAQQIQREFIKLQPHIERYQQAAKNG